jgi:hypothetical protein
VVGDAAVEEAVSTSTRGAADHWRNAIRLQRQRLEVDSPRSFQQDVTDLSGTYLLDAEDMEPDVEALYQSICDFLGDP